VFFFLQKLVIPKDIWWWCFWLGSGLLCCQ